MTKTHEPTPLMQQYFEIKRDYPDTMLFFQVGDFYELFFDDAKQAAAHLAIALTSRGKNKGEPIPLCGVPVHALDHYLTKLVKGGFKVAICDQLEAPKPGTIVKRGVKRVLTPGTLTDTKLLDARSASYLFSFYPAGDSWGLVFSELLTAQIFVTTIASSDKALESELTRFFPDEVLIPNGAQAKELQSYFKRLGYCVTVVHDELAALVDNEISEWLHKQFGGGVAAHVESNSSIQLALRYFYAYMSKNQRECLDQFSSLLFYKPDDFLLLDSATQRNLELVKNAQDGTTKNSLFDIMDCAKTSMGSRMIKKWILRPLVKKEAIIQRQDAVALFLYDIALVNALEQLLVRIGDVERIVGRIALDRSCINDYCALSRVLMVIPQSKEMLKNHSSITLIRIIGEHLGSFDDLSHVLQRALYDEGETEWIIKNGFDERLDQMRALVNHGNQMIIDLENKEQQETGIGSLKIRYNNVQGYYIEVTNTHRNAIPDRYTRIQTLVGRERFMTPELQKIHYEIERARKDITVYEQELFNSLKEKVRMYSGALRKSAHALAHLDALLSLARLAYDNGYNRPLFNDERNIIIKNGRHPVVEQSLASTFIPNDTLLTDDQSLWIITGPNMGGKSTYLRQVAHICVMGHIGSFVPAEVANLPLLDRIFTRLGAHDNVAEGKSTFLVEMEETATICTQATRNSLVILDEVGRGTSTFDGLAIAQAVVEHLFTVIGARCLFATHYHELTQLQVQFPAIAIYYAASKKTAAGIVFLYKIMAGIADGSFGIEVAKLAHLPQGVIERALVLVNSFAQETFPIQQIAMPAKNNIYNADNDKKKQQREKAEKIMNRLEQIDFDSLSPKKAFDLVWELKDL